MRELSTIGPASPSQVSLSYRTYTVRHLSQEVAQMPTRRLPLVRMPIEKPLSLLSQSLTGASSIITGVRDPFLYNPRKALQGQVSSFATYALVHQC